MLHVNTVFGKKYDVFGKHLEMPNRRRVAVMLDLDSPYKRHSSLFAGTQTYAQQQGWETIIDEYADDSLPRGEPSRSPTMG